MFLRRNWDASQLTCELHPIFPKWTGNNSRHCHVTRPSIRRWTEVFSNEFSSFAAFSKYNAGKVPVSECLAFWPTIGLFGFSLTDQILKQNAKLARNWGKVDSAGSWKIGKGHGKSHWKSWNFRNAKVYEPCIAMKITVKRRVEWMHKKVIDNRIN